MERLVGHNLQFILNHTTEKIHLRHQITIILQVALGLDFIHKHYIIHLDVKPANILIAPSQDLNAKICDFGNSQRLPTSHKTLTLKNLSGTVAFMAPEMLKRNTVSCATDVYALAITMWQLHQESRKQPYEGLNNEERVIYAVVRNNLRPSVDDSEDSSGNSLHPDSCLSWCKWGTPEKAIKKAKAVLHELPATDGLTWHRENKDEDAGEEEDSESSINWNEIFAVSHQWMEPSRDLQSEYKDLYTRSWHRKPLHRPRLQEIISRLSQLLDKMQS